MNKTAITCTTLVCMTLIAVSTIHWIHTGNIEVKKAIILENRNLLNENRNLLKEAFIEMDKKTIDISKLMDIARERLNDIDDKIRELYVVSPR
jgi:hypothetical protein